MAPELVQNYMNKSAGQAISSFDGFACDMWALGVMLIQLLTGKLPFWPKSGFNYQSMQALLTRWVSSHHVLSVPAVHCVVCWIMLRCTDTCSGAK